jgi:hypothetical protein
VYFFVFFTSIPQYPGFFNPTVLPSPPVTLTERGRADDSGSDVSRVRVAPPTTLQASRVLFWKALFWINSAYLKRLVT